MVAILNYLERRLEKLKSYKPKNKREEDEEEYSISVYEVVAMDEAKTYIKLYRKKLKGNVIIKN